MIGLHNYYGEGVEMKICIDVNSSGVNIIDEETGERLKVSYIKFEAEVGRAPTLTMTQLLTHNQLKMNFFCDPSTMRTIKVEYNKGME